MYVRNQELDDKINTKTVKCERRTCRWKGALSNLESHQHTSYPDIISASTSSRLSAAKTPELPALDTGSSGTARPQSQSRLRALGQNQTSGTQGVSGARTHRQPLSTSSQNNNNTSSSNPPTARTSIASQRANGPHNGTSTTTRSRTRSRTRNASPQRRVTTSTTGLLLNGRLTSRARIRNGGNAASSNARATSNQSSTETNENTDPATQTTSEGIHIPHPPTSSRSTAAPTTRRLPTLPSLVTMNNVSRSTDAQIIPSIDSNNNISQTTPRGEQVTESPGRHPPQELSSRRPGQRSFGMIRERLMASRQRLDTLMGAFSTELDRGRQDLNDFQAERESRRQEQMAEVRDLGRRLSQVATELQGLLSQRRQIQTQIDTLADNVTGEP